MNRSVVHYMEEGAIKDYFNNVGSYMKRQHSNTNRLADSLDKYPKVKEGISNVVKHNKKHIPKIAKTVWNAANSQQKKKFLGASTGSILKVIGSRLIGGPAGALASSITSHQMSKRPREEI